MELEVALVQLLVAAAGVLPALPEPLHLLPQGRGLLPLQL
jgi:hypothetical protein